MFGNDKFGWTCVLLAGTVALGGCSSLLQGEQYVFPRPEEPSATVRLKYERGTNLHAMNFNDSGCYAGYTPLPYTDGFIEAPVAVGKELTLTYRRKVAGSVCQILCSFTPSEGATYTLKAGFWSETKTGILPLFTSDQYYCGLGVVKKVETQESVEPIQQLRIDAGFTCHRFVKKKP